jgi:hypothetical protein
MGLRDVLGGPGDRTAGRILAISLVASLLAVPLTPSAGAEHGDVGVSLEPWIVSCGNEDWIGFQGRYSLLVYRFCFFVDAESPDYPFRVLDELLFPPDLQRDRCPGDFSGQIVTVGDTRAGLCTKVEHTIPRNPFFIHVGVDTSSCEVPGPQDGEDPAVYVADGGVGVCVVPVVDPGPDTPSRFVSLEPCEPETVDPEARVGGGGARVCADFHVLGFGSDDVNDLVQQGNETANETLDAVRGFAGLDEEP